MVSPPQLPPQCLLLLMAVFPNVNSLRFPRGKISLRDEDGGSIGTRFSNSIADICEDWPIEMLLSSFLGIGSSYDLGACSVVNLRFIEEFGNFGTIVDSLLCMEPGIMSARGI